MPYASRMRALPLWLLVLAIAGAGAGGERAEREGPRLLVDKPTASPRPTADSNIIPRPGAKATAGAAKLNPEGDGPAPGLESGGLTDKYAAAGDDGGGGPQNPVSPTADGPARQAAPEPPPTPEEVEQYRLRLERSLLDKYANHQDYAGRVAWVAVILSKPPVASVDGKFIKVEFDQLVYDNWGGRIPELEKEYFVVTFGSGGAEQVRSDPSVRIDKETLAAYARIEPPSAPPLSRIPGDEAFGSKPHIAPPVTIHRPDMPAWWRPEFPGLD